MLFLNLYLLGCRYVALLIVTGSRSGYAALSITGLIVALLILAGYVALSILAGYTWHSRYLQDTRGTLDTCRINVALWDISLLTSDFHLQAAKPYIINPP